MAGSYKHAVDASGALLCNADIVKMLENGGDWFEFAEEAYGMIWLLAQQLSGDLGLDASEWVEYAQTHYPDGFAYSPGIEAKLPPPDLD